MIAGVSCGLYVVAYAWAVITGDESVLQKLVQGNIRKFISERIADRGQQLKLEMQVKSYSLC